MLGSLKEEEYLTRIRNLVKEAKSISTKKEMENFIAKVKTMLFNWENLTKEGEINDLLQGR